MNSWREFVVIHKQIARALILCHSARRLDSFVREKHNDYIDNFSCPETVIKRWVYPGSGCNVRRIPMPFTIVRQDITKMKVDAIVNAANTDLAMGSGVCGAIFQAAGAADLQRACEPLSPIRTGEAAITPGFSLPSRYVIHAAGPVYRHHSPEKNELLLRSAYQNSLRLAVLNRCGSIAFPLISSGVYGYPKEEALQVAISAIRDFLSDHEMDVYLVVFDKASYAVSEELLGEVRSFVDERYVEEKILRRQFVEDSEDISILYSNEYQKESPVQAAILAAPQTGIEDWINHLDEPFATTLVRLIDRKGKTDVEVYKRANLDRKLFSKIKSGKGYMPSKRTVVALAVALELDLPETGDLLRQAGFALSRSQKFDVIIEYFIVNRRYDIFAINEVLFAYDQPLLGG